ncbi:unnamed protein product [Rhizoctonia solani]|uniref:Ricin B lectin domain-containing protein n=1 Tax=Rhizoctonia solani TaxID=456999 RepID=A0A8H3GZW8_9AGAM|nr:unnamed protein product [Rhizoctonia solani]
MAIREGRYFIQSADDKGDFVGTGPVPRVWPPFPSPLKHLPENWKDVFEIKSLGDKYTITHKTLGLHVGYDDDNLVRLIRMGGVPQPWCIEKTGHGAYCIKHPDSNKCWTTTQEDYGPMIKLEGESGAPSQGWRLELYEDY